jgi:hypothetical protein
VKRDKSRRTLRLANHRPGEDGQSESETITVWIDSALEFDPLLRVSGRNDAKVLFFFATL